MGNEIVERYELAVKNAREAIEELRLASQALGYEDARRDLTKVYPVCKALNRDEIIEKAKRDVVFLSQQEQGNLLRVNFVVNREKRTVVCLMERFDLGYIAKRGIAKADPSDCFNVHIGKVIALGRALGLKIPAEYLNVPQPTEIRVGDIIEGEYHGSGTKYYEQVEKVTGNDVRYTSGGFDVIKDVKIFDDSRE